MSHARSILLGALLILGSAIPAIAGEIRILDSMGLSRAAKYIDGNGKVIISAHAPDNKEQVPDILLSHVDGLAPDIEGTRGPDKSVIFTDVPEGVWKIKAPEQAIVITEVKIVQ